MKVLELLRAHVVKIPPTATVREMVDMLDLYQVLVLPVVDEDDALLGVVYEDQVVKPILDLSSNSQASLSKLAGVTASEIMSSPPPFVDEHDDIQQALERMAEAGATRLVVTNNRVVTGSISRVDICQALLDDQA